MRDVEVAVLAAIDDAAILTDLRDLVAIPSVDGSAAETAAQEWCAERLAGLGLEVDTWDIDVAALTTDADFPGMEVERREALGCVATVSGTDRDSTPALILNGHVDVVPPGSHDAWPYGDPFAVHEAAGALWGRGTCDMKAGVAAIIGAVSAIQAGGARLHRPLAVHTVVGEEDGGLGAFATLRRGHTGAACVIAEPTNTSIIAANAGALTFRLTLTGLATHGATRTRGVSALDKLDVVRAALRDLEAHRNAALDPLFAHLDLGWPISIGVVRAGDWASTVPDRLVAQGRFGVMPGEAPSTARAAFENAIAEAGAADAWLAEHPVRVTWPGGAFASGTLGSGDPLLAELGDVVDVVTGEVPAVRGAPYGSDLRQYIGAGVPCVQYGPGDVQFAHAADEHVPVEEVLRCARVYALLALRLCG